MTAPGLIICVDWGTTHLRLHLCETEREIPIGSISSEEGILSTFRAWQESLLSREEFFRNVLQKNLERLQNNVQAELHGLPLVLSGMASSSIGMRELPYGDLPQPLAGCRLPCARIEADKAFPHPTLLISGLGKEADVMRGEEVQSFGLPALIDPLPDRCVLVLPGTHSKHLWINEGTLTDFRTYMTGELFSLLSQHSILAQSLAPGKAHLRDPAFEEGVIQGSQHRLSHILFSLRARHLRGSLTTHQGTPYLSGLLLGHELSALGEEKVSQIILAAGENLCDPYREALEILGLSPKVRTLTPAEADSLVIRGQLRIWKGMAAN